MRENSPGPQNKHVLNRLERAGILPVASLWAY